MNSPRIDARRVSEILVAARPVEAPVATIYFSHETPLGTDRVALRDLVKKGEQTIRGDDGLDDESRELALAGLSSAADAIAHTGSKDRRGTTIAFALPGGVTSFEIPVPLASRVVVGWSPYVAPLVSAIEHGERAALVVFDERFARIFSSWLGELEELETIEDPAQRNIARAGWLGRDQSRMHHHRETVLHRHYQHVADRLAAYHRCAPFERVVLAGHPPATLAKFERALHPDLASRVVARESWEHGVAPDEIHAHLSKLMGMLDSEKERKLLSRVLDQAGGDLPATRGAEATLTALWQGRVATLIVPAGTRISGLMCNACGLLSAENGPAARRDAAPCRQCGAPTHRVDDLVEEATELAFLNGAKVRFIALAKPELEQLGGMAALVRYL